MPTPNLTEGDSQRWKMAQAHVDMLAEQAVVKTFAKNTIVIQEGDHSDHLYIILSGRVKVFLSDDTGKEVLLSVQGPGEYFGEMVLDDGPRSASVMTTEPTRLAMVSREQFRAYLLLHPDVAMDLILSLIRRVRILTRAVGNLAMLDVYGRVARLLLDLAVEEEGVLVVGEKLTQQDMANRVGASREMVNRILRDLKSGGYIRQEFDRIVISKKPPLPW
ncbi:MAG: Crp/Fnr family transcriptional regulator [Burkholderiales bacterium]